MTTKIPNIPNVSEETILQVLEAIKNISDVREGKVGDKLDKGVTFRDLVGLGLAQDKEKTVVQTQAYTNNISTNLPVYSRNYDTSTGYDPTLDLTPPPQATNLSATSSINNIFLEWNIPSYPNHSLSEIWRSENDNIGDARLIARSTLGIYVDNVVPDTKFNYWIRLVSKASINGAYSSDPVQISATVDPQVIISAVEGEINESSLNDSLSSRINNLESDTKKILAQDTDTKIAEESLVREQTDSGLLSQYTVKIDDNGAVSGFGLASENVNGSTTSSFIIRADKFSVVQPTSTATTLTNTPASATIPFTIDNSGNTILKSAVIGSATISNAQIGNVSTNKLTAGISTSSQFVGGRAKFNYLYAGGTVYYTAGATSGVQEIAYVGNASMFVADNYARFTADSFIVATTTQVNSSGSNQPSSYKPFEVINGTTYIKSAMIQDASIDNAKIGNVIESNNFSSTAGWQINKNGNATFNNITLTGYAQSSDIPDVSGKLNKTGENDFSGGVLEAGVVRSADEKFVIDLSNKSITITT